MEDKYPDNIIKLNIGGEKIVTTKRSTLMVADGSVLEAMFRGSWDESLDRDENGNVFIDQSPDLFLPLLNYMRACRDESPNGPRARPPQYLGPPFDTMIEYYGMTKFVYKLELRVLSMPPPRGAVITSKCNEWSVSSPHEWVTLDLNEIGHNKRITKFTVIMGKFSHARIGWRDTAEDFPAYDKRPQNLEPSHIIKPPKGVGDFKGTIGFECVTGKEDYPCLYSNGETGNEGYIVGFPLDPMDLSPLEPMDSSETVCVEQGTKIECFLANPTERNKLYQTERPAWALNGSLLDDFFTWEPFTWGWAPKGTALPCISIQGDVKIVDVEYDTATQSTNARPKDAKIFKNYLQPVRQFQIQPVRQF
mmetsp:Transcript_47613/g.57348  ORF Transcript_47613/g.57348 Transcript_47613/m.57348 type:complete len:363 (-) Transcript_47613:535-1623(-)